MRFLRMLLVFMTLGLIPMSQVVSIPKDSSDLISVSQETVAMSAIEYSKKWELFLGHQQRLSDDKDWKDLYDAYKSFHKNNNVIITGHVVKIVHKETRNEAKILSICLEGIDSTNEYGFKCNVYLTVNGYKAGFDILGGIPQEQLKSVQVGDTVSVSYKDAIMDDDFSGMFCVNHNDWDNQKSYIDSRLHDAVREHAKEVIRYKNRIKSWWQENAADAKPKIYRVAEHNSIFYDTQVAESIQQKLAKKIRRQYEDSIIWVREHDKEEFNKWFNDWSIRNIMETLTTMRDQSFRIKVCGRKFTDVVEYNAGNGFRIPIPPKVGEIGYIWHWNPDDLSTRYGFSWTSDELNKEIIEFFDKHPLQILEKQ